MSGYSGAVLHFGKYDGCEISYVVLADPAYVVWAAENVKGNGISQYWVNKAMEELDDILDPYESFSDEWDQY